MSSFTWLDYSEHEREQAWIGFVKYIIPVRNLSGLIRMLSQIETADPSAPEQLSKIFWTTVPECVLLLRIRRPV